MSNSSGEFELIDYVSKIVSAKTGVILGERQRGMVQGRIARRLREVGAKNHSEYMVYLKANLDHETSALVSLLTTHHTFFFREFEHFDHILAKSLPKIVEAQRKLGQKKVRILSAACSKGHEVYSLAMFLDKNLKAIAPDFDFEIVGGDVCAESVQFAKNGVYKWEEVKTIPATYLTGNWARGTGPIADYVKVSDKLKNHCKFEMMNLTDLPGYNNQPKFDLVFCRNVFIYFERDLVRRATMKLLERLHPHGDLIVGLSESLNGMDLPLDWEGPSVYKVKDPKAEAKVTPATVGAPAAASKSAPTSVPAPAPVAAKPAPIRVFAVDDSPTVLKLIEKLCKEAGFELVGTAKDGAEALKVLTAPNAPAVSIITLDLHMPNMNGLEFLQAFRKTKNTPVVVVSSINREEKHLAQQALSSGANDYVEKPALDRWKETTSELIAKIRVCAKPVAGVSAPTSGATELDKQFAQVAVAKTASTKRRWILLTSEKARARAIEFAKQNKSRVEFIALSGGLRSSVEDGVRVEPVRDFSRALIKPNEEHSVLVFGELDSGMQAVLGKGEFQRVLLEENSRAVEVCRTLRSTLGAKVDVFPVLSFPYEADRIVNTQTGKKSA